MPPEHNLRTALIGVAVLVATVALLAIFLSAEDTETRTATFHINDTVIASLSVEVVDTPDERKAGLMNRSTLPPGHGMLFVFPKAELRSFWMKHTYLPLDIIFLNAEKQVINVEQADPQPNDPEAALKQYRSDAPAQYVIEARQGFAERHGVGPGTTVAWNRDT